MTSEPTTLSNHTHKPPRWTLLRAARVRDLTGARDALVDLCRLFWPAVHAYVRRCGHPPERAFDIVQAFFDDLVSTELSRPEANLEQPFRRFLLAMLVRFLAGDWRQEVRSGSHTVTAPLTLAQLEALDRARFPETIEAGPAFQRCYALTLVGAALQQLRSEAAQAGRMPLYEALQPYLQRDPQPGRQQELADTLGIRPLALVLALKRLRERFQELVQQTLADTVDASALGGEREALLAVLDEGRR